MQVRDGDRMLKKKENVIRLLRRTRKLIEPEINREKILLEKELGNHNAETTVDLQLWDLNYCSS